MELFHAHGFFDFIEQAGLAFLFGKAFEFSEELFLFRRKFCGRFDHNAYQQIPRTLFSGELETFAFNLKDLEYRDRVFRRR